MPFRDVSGSMTRGVAGIMPPRMDRGATNANEHVGVAEAARILGVGKRTVQNMVGRGELPAERDERNRFVIRRADVENLRDERDRRVSGSGQTNSGAAATPDALVEHLMGEITHLRRESERKDTIILSLSQSNAEQARTIRALEAPREMSSDAPEADVTASEDAARGDVPRDQQTGAQQHQARKSFWSRLFGS